MQFSRQNQVMAQETDLNAVLCELVEEAGKQELYHEVEFIMDLAPGLPTIQADPRQIRQVFLNLMNNAAEASEYSRVKYEPINMRRFCEIGSCSSTMSTTPRSRA